MSKKVYKINKAKVKIFNLTNPWIYVEVPEKITERLKGLGNRGLIPVDVTVGKTKWRTSVLPLGRGYQFIPLKAQVRKAEDIRVNDVINLSFTLH